MTGNSFGRIFRLTTFGESHGAGVGGVLEGCPPGLEIDEAFIQAELNARRPGRPGDASSTPRQEADKIKILSGLFEGRTTGQPIAFFIENTSHESGDYDKLRDLYRPGHADFSWQEKYGIRDHRGGGRSSARETAARVAGGAIALALLRNHGITVRAFCVEFGGGKAEILDPGGAGARAFFAPNSEVAEKWQAKVDEARKAGESLGGIVQVEAHGVPAGLGEPVFDGLDARLGAAFLSVGAVKGVEFGAGFASSRLFGSENNDILTAEGYLTNQAGGILGGVSNGNILISRVGVKPIPSIGKSQQVMDSQGNMHEISIGGRHDLSPIPRIVPVLKAMCALVLADFILLQRCIK